MKFLYAYRNIVIPANIVTLVGGYTLTVTPTIAVLLYLLWWKLFTSILLILYIHFFQRRTVLFFMNLGLGQLRLYTSLVLIDLILFTAILVIIYGFRS